METTEQQEGVKLNVAKVLNQKPQSTKQHPVAIKHHNWMKLKVLAANQGYSQPGVYLNDMLEEIFDQAGIKADAE